MWWGIIIALIIVCVIFSMFSELAEKVGGWGRLLAIAAGIALLIIIFVNYSWTGLLISLGAVTGIAVLLLIINMFSKIVDKHDQRKTERMEKKKELDKELAEIKLETIKEERKKRNEDEYYKSINKPRQFNTSNQTDIEIRSREKHSKSYFRYLSVPLIIGPCDVSGEPEKFDITIITCDNHRASFNVENGQISGYSFSTRYGNQHGKYKVE